MIFHNTPNRHDFNTIAEYTDSLLDYIHELQTYTSMLDSRICNLEVDKVQSIQSDYYHVIR